MAPRIEDYGLIGDGETAALVSRDGSIDWLCWPRFDSDACFAALLGREENGRWWIGPTFEGWSATRRYRPDTLVLETEFARGGNAVRITDFMPLRNGPSTLIRMVTGLSGEVELGLDLALRFDYGLLPPWHQHLEDGFCAVVGPDRVVLRTTVPLALHRDRIAGVFTVSAGQTLTFALAYDRSDQPLPPPIDAARALAATDAWWRDWAKRFRTKTEWHEAVIRSLITLKALIHRPTGGLLAAPTTSLPEVIGGGLNWDYRYCWLRDATFTISALLNAGYHEEAIAWRDWMLRAVAGRPDKLRTMYRVDGARHINEWKVDWLTGYEDSRPVRVGNAAAAQEQLDVPGELIDAMHLIRQAGIPNTEHGVAVEKLLVERLEQTWKDGGHGLWESRGEPQRYVYSKAMVWAGLDRFLTGSVTEEHADPGLIARLTALRAEVHNEVCREGFDHSRGHFVQHYGSRQLDASLLLLAPIGFLPVSDDRLRGTIEAIARELTEDGFVLREPRSESPSEGAFLACTCWLADCRTMQGRNAEAKELLERVLAVRNDLGLVSEEFDLGARRLCGNFPQALTHLALVNTALGLSGPVLQRAGG